MRGVTTDLTSNRYGNLLVVGIAPKQGAGSWWQCVCDCGNACVKAGKDLTKSKPTGWVHSCGCRPALVKSIYKRLRDQGDARLKLLHVEQSKRR
jgi:hypothetical protein